MADKNLNSLNFGTGDTYYLDAGHVKYNTNEYPASGTVGRKIREIEEPFYFHVNRGSQGDITILQGLTIEDIYNAFSNGKNVLCVFVDYVYSINGCYHDSSGRIIMTFTRFEATSSPARFRSSVITLDTAADVGDGYHSYWYLEREIEGPLIFEATSDNQNNVTISGSVTISDIYNAFRNGRNVLCFYINAGDYYSINGCYHDSSGRINMTFTNSQTTLTGGIKVGIITLDTNATVGDGYYSYRYLENKPFIFEVIFDSQNNVTISGGLTINDIYNAFCNERNVLCHIGHIYYLINGCYNNLNGRIIMTFTNFQATKSGNLNADTITLDTAATVGDGYYSYRYLINTNDYNPVSKTSSMTKSVGVDEYGALWTTP